MKLAPITSKLGAAIHAANNRVASKIQWRQLVKAGFAAQLSDGRTVLRLPAYDYLSKWNEQIRRAKENSK
jgi:hypothetical protein